MDSPETLAAIKEIQAEVVGCFMSGHTRNYSNENLLALSAIAVIEKLGQ